MKKPINKIHTGNWLFRFYITFLLIFISNYGYSQLTIPKKPSFIPPIIDSTQTLSEIQKQQLFEKLKNYSDSTSTEIFVMIVPTTQGEDIARYATDLGQKWEIGQKGKDNGIIFLIAKNDRKMSIQTGYGVEHLLTDALSRRIIEQEVKPEFREDRYFEGIDNGVTAIFKVLKGEYKGTPKKNKNDSIPIGVFIMIFVVIIILISRNKGNGRGGNGIGGPSLLDMIILSNMGRSSGGSFGGGFGGSSGSGGFGGFGGGGSFGGGGASGSW